MMIYIGSLTKTRKPVRKSRDYNNISKFIGRHATLLFERKYINDCTYSMRMYLEKSFYLHIDVLSLIHI